MSIYNLEYENPRKKARAKLIELFEQNKTIKIEVVKKKRSLTQNRSLHLFFTKLAHAMNDKGMTLDIPNPMKAGEAMEVMPTDILIKELLWKPIQMQLFGYESTTDLTTQDINHILDVLANAFSQSGIGISFPCQYDLLVKQLEQEF